MLLLAESFLHDFDPFAMRFPASWPIDGVRWYGLSYAMGFILGWIVVSWMARTRRSTLMSRDVGDMMFAVILGVLVGGRLGYALFYERHLLFDFHSHFPWWGLFEINRGGMASHGGIIGVIIALTIFGRRRNISILHMLDLAAYVSTIGLCLGRIANFINAELWGRPIPESMQVNPPWWSVKYPQQISDRWLAVVERAPHVRDDEYADLVTAAASDFNIHAPPGELTEQVVHEAQRRLDVLGQQLQPVIGFDSRFFARVEEIARDAQHTLHGTVVATLKPLLTAYYPSQIMQAITDGPILIGVLTLIWLRPRKPGVIGAWFLSVYAMLRVISEFFRQPDAGVSLTFGLSRGQMLSVLMFVTGCVCLYIASRRDVPKVGGLLRGSR
jgi:phosphatidylglycerol:prolipoprotein diacylglycerol transferase